jgi:signal peptidase II
VILPVVSILAVLFSLLVSWGASGLTQPIILLPGFIKLQLSHNPGIAFSISIPSPWEEILIISALTAVCVFAIRSKPNTLSSISFGLIIGGAVANLIDRIPDGLVTDYIAIGTFPVFNAADSFITIGAVLLLVESWLKRPQKA